MSVWSSLVFWVQDFFLLYFSAINSVYTVLLIMGVVRLYHRRKEVSVEDFGTILRSDSLPEVCFIMCMYNESQNIVSAVQNILHLTYRYKRIIVVNDGSTDDCMEVLKKAVDLVLIPQFYETTLPTAHVRGVYRSKKYPEIIAIDKEHKGKYDALNAGLNATSNPFFIAADADSYIDDETFEAIIRPILSAPKTIAVGASVRIRNGCTLQFNRISAKKFPRGFLAAMQQIEYLRSFLMRQGWDWVGGHFVIAGVFSIFSTDLIKTIGGFSASVAEDLEIIVRLHRILKPAKIPYKILYLPDPVSWTEGPATWQRLAKQRTRWHLGLLESIWYHKSMVLNYKYGLIGLMTTPYMIWGEAIEPLIEGVGFLYILGAWLLGVLDVPFFIVYLLLSFGFTCLYTVACLFIEELSFRKFSSLKAFGSLLACSLIENFGYRQLSLLWRMRAFGQFFTQFSRINRDAKQMNALVAKQRKTP